MKDIRLKRRDQLIKNLREKINDLEKSNIDAAVLKDKQLEADALIYQLNELLGKLSDEIREVQEAKKEYEDERKKFIKLNVEYKKKMEKFMKECGIGKEDDG